MNNKKLGQQGEEKAKQFLIQKGLDYIMKNYRCQFGEIDLIFYEKNTLIIVEVKKNNTNQFGTAFEKVTFQKQQKIIRTTEYFIQRHQKWTDCNCRFDVVGIDQNQIQWIQDAFQTCQ